MKGECGVCLVGVTSIHEFCAKRKNISIKLKNVKKLIEIKIALLIYLAFICSPKDILAQDQISVEGIWEVSEGLDSLSTMDIWQFNNSLFCNLKYSSDFSEDLICDEAGEYTVTDSLLTIEINSEDGELYKESLLVQFRCQYINEHFVLRVSKDSMGMMRNMVTERLLMVRRR